MATTLSSVVLYIHEHSNGTTTYRDENGVTYVPFEEELEEEIIHTDIGLQSAFVFAAISLVLVLLGGITSGLNLALMNINAEKNKLLLELSDKSEHDSHKLSPRKEEMMKKMQPLIADRHLLLVTLLVGNATCMEALPIFLDKLVASWMAILLSVTFVLIFGEILPQAYFSRDPLVNGYKLRPLVLALKWILFPICKPLAWMLDLLFHQEPEVVFTQSEVSWVMSKIESHADQRKLIEGAFNIGRYTVKESSIAWNDVTCFDANTKLDAAGLKAIYKTACSRIPIYENRKDNVIGILLVKTLVICDPDPNLTIKAFLKKNFGKVLTPTLIVQNKNLYDAINIFQVLSCTKCDCLICIILAFFAQDSKSHFAMVCEEQDEIEIMGCWRNGMPIPDNIKWCGIITLEDIMEDIIQEEIDDEFDAEKAMNWMVQANVLEEAKSNWTEDEEFAASVTSRFTAKNRRTIRAQKRKSNMKNSRTLDENLSTLPVVNDVSPKIHLEKRQSMPLLSQKNASINMKKKTYGSAKTDNISVSRSFSMS